jgi:hypothetical protein
MTAVETNHGTALSGSKVKGPRSKVQGPKSEVEGFDGHEMMEIQR